MAKKRTAATSRNSAVAKAVDTLRHKLGYLDVRDQSVEGEDCLVAYDGDHPLVLVYIPSATSGVTAAAQELGTQLGAVIASGPSDYVWVTATGEPGEGFYYSWLPDKEGEVPELPAGTVAKAAAPARRTPASRRVDPIRFKALQEEFDNLHEHIYAQREPVDGANDLTAQLCKLIFLKMHLERHLEFRPVPGGPLLEEVFAPDYIRRNKDKAVQAIRKAFEVAKELPEYCVSDDRGRSFRIFDQDDFIKFQRPETYAKVTEILSKHRLTEPEVTGVEDDVLGRAFDVMLRAKFEGKGGMGIYLTPQQVRDAMVQMAFHDILKEDPGAITRRDPRTGQSQFSVCDLCCGSAGFLITAMREVRKHVGRLLGLTDVQRASLLADIFSKGFEGADSSPNMVLMARINMALHGDPMARVYRVENSLLSDVFLPCSFDLILTNPPFKKGGITDKDNSEILSAFTTDVANEDLRMTDEGLALGCKPDAKGRWKPIRSVDPAVLFIDRCLQLLKPGGRLLIVVPDGILCNAGDRYVREYLMGKKDERTGRFVGGKAVVRAVVSLPPVTFKLSGAGAKTSFVYLQKKRPGDEQGPVFMAVANQVGFDVKQNKEVLTGQNELASIIEAYKQGPRALGESASGHATPQ